MPSLDFVLPHWLYWSGLVLFPLLAMSLIARERRSGPPGNASYPIAYLLWVSGGFIGLHRFYLRSWLGLVYIPLVIAILAGNAAASQARLDTSEARQEVTKANFLLERAVQRQGEDSEAAGELRNRLESARAELQVAAAERDRVDTITLSIASAVAILLLLDAFLLPRLINQYRNRYGARAPPMPEPSRGSAGKAPPMPAGIPGRIVWCIDRVSGWTGYFIAYWSILAVFIYYYEVVARYGFNSPTNWAHESMFLMFGMQYVLSGAFALREGSHVRVDVVHQYLPPKGKAIVDLITSVFFFIFVGAILWTGWTFATDAFAYKQVSFTEWAIQYWPIKFALPVGAALILLQGIAEVIRSASVLTGWEVPVTEQHDNAVARGEPDDVPVPDL